jgi:serine/threonine protein kinase
MAASPSDRGSVLERLLDQALGLDPEQRSAFLDRTCPPDPALRADIERLLRAGEAPDGFLEEGALALASPLIGKLGEHPSLAPGERLGPYLIERELGHGGMATVYLARDRRDDRQVALKALRPELSGLLAAERFAREIEVSAGLDHPHILPLHDSGILDAAAGPPVYFYAMPYVAGGSLRGRLNDEIQLPLENALEIASQVADALDYAHRRRIIHRDIKPENILLSGPDAVVADFGIARAVDAAGTERLTGTGLTLGTPTYMSPEQATGESRLDGRSDLYALGCVLYEMLAGQPPFLGATSQAVLARHAAEPVPALRTVRPAVSPALERVVTRALAKPPADRFPTAAAFGRALAAARTAG